MHGLVHIDRSKVEFEILLVYHCKLPLNLVNFVLFVAVNLIFIFLLHRNIVLM